MSILGPLRDWLREKLERRWLVPTPRWRLQNLAERGFVAEHIVDVGAYHGEFCVLARRCFPSARLTVLEGAPPALAGLRKRLADWPRLRVLPVLAGAEDCQAYFLLQESNSRVISAEQAGSFAPENVLMVPVQPLDTLLAADAVIDLLKIDVQGHELAVLAGAQAVLRRTRAILVEVSVLQIGDAPGWRAVLDVLEAAGFVLIDLVEPKYRPRDYALWQIDLLLLRADDPLLKDRSW